MATFNYMHIPQQLTVMYCLTQNAWHTRQASPVSFAAYRRFLSTPVTAAAVEGGCALQRQPMDCPLYARTVRTTPDCMNRICARSQRRG